MNRRRTLFAATALAPAAIVGATIAVSPDPSGGWVSPLGQRLLYLHVPLAWGAYVAFAGALVAALAVLRKKNRAGSALMQAATELTAVYASASLASGLAWSYEFQLYNPLEDPKVLTTLVLCLAAGGLWVFAASTRYANPRRSAALTIVAFLAVPASYWASRISVHPDFARGTTIDTTLGTLLGLSTFGLLLLGVAIAWLRVRMVRVEQEASAW